MLRAFLLTTAVLATFVLSGQVITMLNPGFEGEPKFSTIPPSWMNCGPVNESPPDTGPVAAFQVSTVPYEGNSYMGMVTRDNNTTESACTYLTEVLKQGQCYQFSLAVAKSGTYYSVSRTRKTPARYNNPTRLKIWGGVGQCGREELLAESPIINHEDWQVYTFIIKPEMASYSVITLEACYPKDDPAFFTNGNMLLDEASAFIMLPDCGKEAFGIDQRSNLRKTVIITQTEAPSMMEDNTIYLKLPPESYFTGAEPLKIFLSNVFSDIEQSASGRLVGKSYQLDDEKEVRTGYPSVHAMLYALNAYPGEKWELVVFDRNTERQRQRVISLSEAVNNGQPHYVVDCQVRGYDAALDDGTDWFCMSVNNGLYLIKR
ncbi:MAG: hypothetical protein ACRBG0_10375 [Lewinella sp.]|uniref:hypothetical protein n=1 Tax=Lewinella sp. TaxID=2004506 RepID=UPI003D6A80C6